MYLCTVLSSGLDGAPKGIRSQQVPTNNSCMLDTLGEKSLDPVQGPRQTSSSARSLGTTFPLCLCFPKCVLLRTEAESLHSTEVPSCLPTSTPPALVSDFHPPSSITEHRVI